MNRDTIIKWENALQDIVTLHNRIKDIDQSLEELYPVAIVKNNIFFVFDYDASADKYGFVMEHSIPNFQIPDQVLASFPLDFYENKPAAVVSGDALYEIEKQVFIFHEFVHCYQNLNGETEIKESLEIYKKYQKENNPMWELTHAFPYDGFDFVEKVNELIRHYNKHNSEEIQQFYSYMKANLSNIDYEYLIWQEFKEGYARYVENNIRTFLQLDLNDNSPKAPFERPVFYWTGSRHIDLITNIQNKKYDSIKQLFELML